MYIIIIILLFLSSSLLLIIIIIIIYIYIYEWAMQSGTFAILNQDFKCFGSRRGRPPVNINKFI